jgi:hypothetical protein
LSTQLEMAKPKSVMRIGHLSFCYLRGCGSNVARHTPRNVSFEDVLDFKKSPSIMTDVRRLVAQHGVALFLSHLDDHEALEAFTRLFERKILLRCADPAAAVPKSAPVQNQAQMKAAEILQTLADKNRLAFEGQSYILMRTDHWRSLPKDEQYQVVPAPEARKIIKAAATDQPLFPPTKEAWRDSSDLFSRTSVSPNDGPLVLLRIVPKRIFRSPTSEAAITPSQLARIMTEKHWIEIVLVDEDGAGVEGIKYSIIAPDNNEYTGNTGPDGFARVDNIPAGQCKISFPELDRDSYKSS